MINKNFKSLKRSSSQIAHELGRSPTTISKYLQTPLFKKSFVVPSYYKKCKDEKRKHKSGEISKKEYIPYKIKLSIYYLMKLCLKNFSALNKLKRRYNNYSNAGKSNKPTGSDILEYNRMVLNDILSEEPDLPEFQKTMLKAHKSVRYAAVMNKYYERFVDDISTIVTFAIDGSIPDHPKNFLDVIEYLEEAIWLFTLKHTVKEYDNNPEQFNINNALRDVICVIDKHKNIGDEDYNKKSLTISEEEYNLKLKMHEEEYFKRLQEKFQLFSNEIYKQYTDDFYKNLKEKRKDEDKLFNNFYDGVYIDFFKEYIKGDQCKALKYILHQPADIYGRMYLPSMLDEIDVLLSIKTYLCSSIADQKPITSAFLAPEHIKLLRCNFIYIGEKNDQYYYYTEAYVDNEYIMIEFTDDPIRRLWRENDREKCASIISRLGTFLQNKDLTVTFGKDEEEIVNEYFNHCFCTHAIHNFNESFKAVVRDYNSYKEENLSDDTYKKIKHAIDSSVGAKWSDVMFAGTADMTRKDS